MKNKKSVVFLFTMLFLIVIITGCKNNLTGDGDDLIGK